MNLARRLQQLLAAVLCLLFSSSALAASGTVVLVADPRVLPLARRLQQEIESLGLQVNLQDPTVASAAPPSATPVVATIRLAPLGGSDVDLTIVDSATGKTVSYKLIATSGTNDVASELVATRTVELLRASLLRIASSSAEPAEPPPAKSAPEPPPRRAPLRDQSLSLAVGVAPVFSSSFQYGVQLHVGATWLPSRHFGVMAAVLPSLAPLRLRETRGSVDLFGQLYRLGGVIALGDDSSLVSVRALFGAELDRLRFEGHAAEPYESASETRLSLSPFLGGALRLRLTNDVHLWGELAAALSMPRTTVRIANEEVGDFGRPLATAALGLELTWPSSSL